MFIKFLIAAVFAGTPLLFGTVGEIMNEKAGHLNLGVEGMMAMGACAGFMAGFFSNNIYIALLAAFLAGMLGALIYAARKEKGLTQEELAEKIGSTKSYISKIENDIKEIRLSTLKKIIELGLGGQLQLSIKL